MVSLQFDIEKGIKRLDKCVYYVKAKTLYQLWITRDDKTKLYRDQYVVLFKQKEKVKLGSFQIPFTLRYGIEVFATFNGTGFWGNNLEEEDMKLMRELWDSNDLGGFETFKFADHKDRINW